jgi:hypothetical protein
MKAMMKLISLMLALAASGPAMAATLFTLSGVAFQDGGTMSGYFVTNAKGVIVQLQITTTAGTCAPVTLFPATPCVADPAIIGPLPQGDALPGASYSQAGSAVIFAQPGPAGVCTASTVVRSSCIYSVLFAALPSSFLLISTPVDLSTVQPAPGLPITIPVCGAGATCFAPDVIGPYQFAYPPEYFTFEWLIPTPLSCCVPGISTASIQPPIARQPIISPVYNFFRLLGSAASILAQDCAYVTSSGGVVICHNIPPPPSPAPPAAP